MDNFLWLLIGYWIYLHQTRPLNRGFLNQRDRPRFLWIHSPANSSISKECDIEARLKVSKIAFKPNVFNLSCSLPTKSKATNAQYSTS